MPIVGVNGQQTYKPGRMKFNIGDRVRIKGSPDSPNYGFVGTVADIDRGLVKGRNIYVIRLDNGVRTFAFSGALRSVKKYTFVVKRKELI